MALVTVSGFPTSGKTRRSHELKAFFECKIQDPAYTGPVTSVVVVDDPSVHVTRDAYDDSKSEKPARAALFAAVTRNMSPETLTIVDSSNYIKGFRYQMYCAAREAGVRVATLRTAVPPSLCLEWEEAREEQYKRETFDNLIQRYEEPNSMVRWDSPLFTVAWDDELPGEDIWAASTSGMKKPPTQASVVRSRPPPGTLQTLTSTTSLIVTSLLAHLSAAPGATTFPIPSPPATKAGDLVLQLPAGRRPTLSELQRLKRQFEATQTTAQKTGGRAAGNWTEPQVASSFVTFLETVWGNA